jgi:uncharacterized protein (TIRG00374 family)
MVISIRAFHRYSVAFGIIFLAVLIWKIGPTELLLGLHTLSWGIVPLILMEGLAQIFHTQGWRHCLSGPPKSLPFSYIFRVHMAGHAINYLTPMAGLGGEVTKGALLSLNRYGPQAASAVIIGKVAYALAHLFYVSLGILLVYRKVDLGAGAFAAMLIGLVLVGAGIIVFLMIQRQGKLEPVLRWLVRRGRGGSWLERAADQIRQVDFTIQLFYRERPRALFLAVAWHMAGLTCGILQNWYFLSVQTGSASVILAASISFMGNWVDLVGFALPSDIGILEGTRVVMFRLFGFTAALGLTYGVTVRLLQIFWASAGLLMYTTFFVRKRGGHR